MLCGPNASAVRQLAPKYARCMEELAGPIPLPTAISTRADLEALSKTSIYFAGEQSPQWRRYFSNLHPLERDAELVKAKVWSLFARARHRQLCLYCWLPAPELCICGRVLRQCDTIQRAMRTRSQQTTAMPLPFSLFPPPIQQHPVEQKQQPIRVTFILHDEELMRTTNTAHIAALAMDAGMLVAGLVDGGHEAKIRSLGAFWRQKGKMRSGGDRDDISEEGESRGAKSDGGKKEEVEMDVLLYPAVGTSVPFHDLLAFRQNYNASSSSSSFDDDHFERSASVAKIGSLPSPSLPLLSLPSTLPPPPPLHICVSDGTWHQARAVSRRVPPDVPRAALAISSQYEALFAGLRKRTRADGVSSLEATMIAVSQAIAAQNSHRMIKEDCSTNFNHEIPPVTATVVAAAPLGHACAEHSSMGCENELSAPSPVAAFEASLMQIMKEFVDIVSIVACKPNVTSTPSPSSSSDTPHITPRSAVADKEDDSVIEINEGGGRGGKVSKHGIYDNHNQNRPLQQRARLALSDDEVVAFKAADSARKMHTQRSKEAEREATPPSAADVKALLPAPVANYCYICDVLVGYERMVKHVQGQKHLTKKTLNPRYEPSQRSGSAGRR